MRTNTLVVLIAIAILGLSSPAMAHGVGGGGGGGKGGSGMSHGHFGNHGHFGHHFFPRFLRNQVFFGDGWGWGWGSYPGSGGDTTVFVSQSAPRFPAADVTGSTAATPCRWNAETFNVPSSAGGKRPVEVVSCR
jgi:hypothetical protein